MVWLLKDLQVDIVTPSQLFCDNQAAWHIANNPVNREQTKHVEMDCYFVQERVDTKEIVLQKDTTTYALNVNEESSVHGVSMSFGYEVIGLVHNHDDLNHFSANVQFGIEWDVDDPLTLKKWTMNTRLFKEELTCIPVWVKLHDVSIQVFLKDGISLITTQIGKPVMIDSFTSSMCIDSWGHSSFARCLIEVKVDVALKDSVTIGIPLLDGEGFTKEMVQVDYEWKPRFCDHCKIFGHVYYQCPKNVTGISILDKMKNDCFQMVATKRKSGKTGSTINNCSGAAACKVVWQPIKQKVSYEPKAHGNLPKNNAPKVSGSAKDATSKKPPTLKGGFHVPTSKPSVPTSNPYDVLDDMESDEEVEVVYDEIVNLSDTRTGASPSIDRDGSNT
ncbi:zinc knuckle CX2CX4HX4C containing protein [Tanacetum coccineum]